MEILDVEAAVVKYSPEVAPGGGGTPDDNSVSTQKIVNKAVVDSKLDDMPADSFKTNPTGSTGIPQNLAIAANRLVGRGPTGHIIGLTPAAGIVLTDTGIGRAAFAGGDVTGSADSAVLTIGTNVVTDAKASQLEANTIKANPTTGIANGQNLAIAASRIVGRGPGGNITGLSVSAGITLSDTAIGRAAFSGGDVTGAADSAVLTIGANAVTDAKAAQLPTKTLKGNSTAGTANGENLTVIGGLSFETGKLKSRSSMAFPMLWDTQTPVGNTAPGTNKLNLNTTNTILMIDVNSLGGANLDTFFNTVLRGQLRVKSNNVSSAAGFRFNVTGSASDLGDYWSFTGALVNDGFTMPADGEEVLLDYVQVATSADVAAINKTLSVVTHNALKQLLDKDGVVMSNSPVVADLPTLISTYAAADYAGFCFRVANQGLYGIDYQSNGTVWSPVQGTFLLDMWTNPAANALSFIWPAATFNGPYTLTNAGGETLISCPAADVHGLTAAVAVGKYIYVKAGTNMVGPQRITAIAADSSGLTIQIAKAYNAANTITSIAIAAAGGGAASQFSVRDIDIPILRANSSIEVMINMLSITDLTGSPTPVGRYTNIKLGADVLYTQNYSSVTVDALPARFIISNTGNVALQRAVATENSNGYVASGVGAPNTGTTNTGVGSVLSIIAGCDTANLPNEYVHGEVYIRG